MATPDDRRYTDQHEWALVQGTDGTSTVVRVGITDHAQDALGDIVFVQLPEVGDEVGPGTPIGEVESTKSVSDVYAPVAGVGGRRQRRARRRSRDDQRRPVRRGLAGRDQRRRRGRRPDRRSCSTPPPTRRWSTRPDGTAGGPRRRAPITMIAPRTPGRRGDQPGSHGSSP